MGKRGRGFKSQETRVPSENCCTGPDVRVSIVRAAPVDVQPAAAPAHVRDAAIRVPRTGTERDVLHVQVFACFHEELQLVEQALEEGHRDDALCLDVVGRDVLQLLVDFLNVLDPDSIGAVLRVAVVLGDILVEVVEVAPRRELALAGPEDLVEGRSLRHQNQTREAGRLSRDLDIGQVDLDAEMVAVELDPARELGFGLSGLEDVLAASLVLDEHLKPSRNDHGIQRSLANPPEQVVLLSCNLA